MSTADAAQVEAFRKVTSLTYAEQAKFYLNAFWTSGADAEAEEIWKICEGFVETDFENGEKGSELNEIQAHHYLQKIGRTLTALELRAELRKIDLDANGNVALAEYLLFRFSRQVKDLLNNPQGGEANPEELKAATAQLDHLNATADQLKSKLENQKQLEDAARSTEAASVQAAASAEAAEAEATSEANAATEAEAAATAAAQTAADAADSAKKTAEAAREQEAAAVAAEASASEAKSAAEAREQEAQVAETAAAEALAQLQELEEKSRQAEAEARAVAEELVAQQNAHDAKLKELAAKAADESIGIVASRRAANELAQASSQDPLPLQRAKINQEAAVRALARARQAAEENSKRAAELRTEAAGRLAALKTALEHAEQEKNKATENRSAATASRATAEESAANAAEQEKRSVAAREAAVAAREAAVSKRDSAVAARAAAVSAAEAASQARKQAEDETRAIEALIADVTAQVAATEASLQELRSRSSVPHGAIWWMERVITERKKYLPKYKQ